MHEQILLELFYYQPMSAFGVRELSRKTNLDTKTVMKYLRQLISQRLVVRKKEPGHFPHYEANRLSQLYRFEKSHSLIKKILQTGLLYFLEKKCRPKTIVIIGSVQKGTYHRQSDIDLFVQAPYKKLNLARFENSLGHKISLLFESDMKTLNKGLIENIYNGEILFGKLELP